MVHNLFRTIFSLPKFASNLRKPRKFNANFTLPSEARSEKLAQQGLCTIAIKANYN